MSDDSISSHTTGPWTSHARDLYLHEVMAGSNVIAEVPGSPRLDYREQVANARLIAAAPDLYEACRALVAGFLPETLEGEDDPDIAQGLRAIAKAEGRES